MNKKATGILLPIFSLHNRYPIGDIGPAAYQFVDYLVDQGHKFWQILPTGPTGKDYSPYSTVSAFGGNPLLISPDLLVKAGLINTSDIDEDMFSERVNYDAAFELKSRLLKKAFIYFESHMTSTMQSQFEAFVETESSWLSDFTLFFALQDKEHESDWAIENKIRYLQFVQWQFSLQWQALRQYCAQKNIQLIGDMPLFVSHNSPDVWAHASLFKLDINHEPSFYAGVPPDYFSKTGQLWQMPVYRWDVLEAENFYWWIERIQHALKLTDIIRLDHFIGFLRTYEIPASDNTALHGQYQNCPGYAFFEKIKEVIGTLPFIADDLGAITQEVEDFRDYFIIPGTKVLQFALKDVMEYPENSVVYTSTHDNDTCLGWYQSLNDEEREEVDLQINQDNIAINDAMIRAALASPSKIAIFPMQDILGLGSEARMNTPGTTEGNWEWRILHYGD